MKKLLSIQRVPIKNAKTTKNLSDQHPSWNIAAIVLRKRIMINTTEWKIAITKLILTIADGPKQSEPPPEASGHYSAVGK